jgi:hypothetical protein
MNPLTLTLSLQGREDFPYFLSLDGETSPTFLSLDGIGLR